MERYRDRRDEEKGRFIQLEVSDTELDGVIDIEVTKGDVRIRFKGMVPAEYLAQLLALV